MKSQLTKINMETDGLDCCSDEQYSRPQKNNYGAAPYATNTVMNGQGVIINMTHVSKETVKNSTLKTQTGSVVKSLGKVGHCLSFEYLRDNVEVGFISCYCLCPLATCLFAVAIMLFILY